MTPSEEMVTGVEAYQSVPAGWGTDSCSIPPVRTDFSPVRFLCMLCRSAHMHLKEKIIVSISFYSFQEFVSHI